MPSTDQIYQRLLALERAILRIRELTSNDNPDGSETLPAWSPTLNKEVQIPIDKLINAANADIIENGKRLISKGPNNTDRTKVEEGDAVISLNASGDIFIGKYLDSNEDDYDYLNPDAYTNALVFEDFTETVASTSKIIKTEGYTKEGKDDNYIPTLGGGDIEKYPLDPTREKSGNRKGYKVLKPTQAFTTSGLSSYGDHILEIKEEFDLGGNSVTLPSNLTLRFIGGYIKNGTLIGDDTRVDAGNEQVFENVEFEGTWRGKGNVYWYGYDRTGLSDSSAAAQKCLDIYGHLDIPIGEMRLENPITYKSGDSFKGESGFTRTGSGRSVIRIAANCGIQSADGTTVMLGVSFQDIYFTGGEVQLDIGNAHEVTVKNITFSNFSKAGFIHCLGEKNVYDNLYFVLNATLNPKAAFILADYNDSPNNQADYDTFFTGGNGWTEDGSNLTRDLWFHRTSFRDIKLSAQNPSSSFDYGIYCGQHLQFSGAGGVDVLNHCEFQNLIFRFDFIKTEFLLPKDKTNHCKFSNLRTDMGQEDIKFAADDTHFMKAGRVIDCEFDLVRAGFTNGNSKYDFHFASLNGVTFRNTTTREAPDVDNTNVFGWYIEGEIANTVFQGCRGAMYQVLNSVNKTSGYFDALTVVGGSLKSLVYEENIRGKIIEASVSGTYNFDYSQGTVFVITMTGDTVFSETNLPISNRSIAKTIILNGDFQPDFSGLSWLAKSNNDVYNGASNNLIHLELMRLSGGGNLNYYSLENLS